MPSSRRNRAPPDIYAKYENSGFSWFKNEKAEHPSDPRVFFKVHQFKCPCNHPEWSEWESPISWDEDGMPCENPECKDNDLVLPYTAIDSVTPCSFSKEKFFGRFSCHKCGRNWDSAHAWTETFQKCEVCIINIYPYDMDVKPFHLKPRKGERSHIVELCQKCQAIKGDCSKLRRGEGSDETQGKRFYRRRPKKSKKNKKPKEESQVQETPESKPEQATVDTQSTGQQGQGVALGQDLVQEDAKKFKPRKKNHRKKNKTSPAISNSSKVDTPSDSVVTNIMQNFQTLALS